VLKLYSDTYCNLFSTIALLNRYSFQAKLLRNACSSCRISSRSIRKCLFFMSCFQQIEQEVFEDTPANSFLLPCNIYILTDLIENTLRYEEIFSVMQPVFAHLRDLKPCARFALELLMRFGSFSLIFP
jgi:hypothetical protein